MQLKVEEALREVAVLGSEEAQRMHEAYLELAAFSHPLIQMLTQ